MIIGIIAERGIYRSPQGRGAGKLDKLRGCQNNRKLNVANLLSTRTVIAQYVVDVTQTPTVQHIAHCVTSKRRSVLVIAVDKYVKYKLKTVFSFNFISQNTGYIKQHENNKRSTVNLMCSIGQKGQWH